MKTISQELIDAVWDEAMATPPEEAQEKFQSLFEAQPCIAAFLLYVEEELLPPEDQGMVLMIGYCVVKTMLEQGNIDREIEQEEIEEAERKNMAALEAIEEGSDFDFAEHVSKLMSTYPQAPLLSTVLQALMEDHEEDPDNAPENIGMIFLSFKAIIDCLDR